MYCRGNPIKYSDPSGYNPAAIAVIYVWGAAVTASPDTQMDMQFIAQDLAQGDYLSAGLDAIGMGVPGVTGVGQLSRPIRKAFNRVLHAIKPITTGRWAKGSFESAEASLRSHFYKHGGEVGANDVEQYLRKADEFAKNLKGSTSKPLEGYTENVTRYYKGNRYVDLTHDKQIVSFGAR